MEYKYSGNWCRSFTISSFFIVLTSICNVAQTASENSRRGATPKNCVYNCLLEEPAGASDNFNKTSYVCTEGLPNKSLHGKQHIVTKITPIPNSWILKLKVNEEAIPTNQSQDYIILTSKYSGTVTPTPERIITVMSLQDHCILSENSNIKRLSKSKSGVIEACNGKLKKIRQPSGNIKSPGFPRPYPKKKTPIKCRWKIATDPGSLLEISFKNIDLKSTTHDYPHSKSAKYERYRITHGKTVFSRFQNCKDEYVTITDPVARKNQPGWVHYGKFCGDWTAPKFVSVGNAVVITFMGSSSGRKQGFLLKYNTVKPPRGVVVTKVQDNDLNWNDTRNQCKERRKDLCRIKDVCGIGRPFYGVEKANVWTPVLDEYDDWLQIGEAKGQTCQRHNKLYGPPQWGRTGFSRPSINQLYCCDPMTTVPDGEFLTADNLPAAHEVLVKIYSTVQNGRTFYRYLRENIDTLDDGEVWSFKKVYDGDLSTIILYSSYHTSATEPVYFCYKRLLLAIGQMRTVYSLSNKPCDLRNWKMSYYLYAAKEDNSQGVQTIYVGVSSFHPYHTRLHFGGFPSLFRNSTSFILHAKTNDPKPESMVNGTRRQPETGVTCSTATQNVIAPAVLMSPGFPKKYRPLLDCKWRIRLSDSDIDLGMKLQITVEELELEDESDYLLVYDVTLDTDINELSHRDVTKQYTGNMRSTSLTTENAFLLHFKSDYSIEKKGFRIVARTLNDKCGGFIRNHGATVQSPNFPKPYQPELKCSWMIEAPVGFGIEIQFLKFELANSTKCQKDVVRIGASARKSELFCGVREKPPIRDFNDRVIYLNFTTREPKSKHKGFVFTVRFWPVGNLRRNGSKKQKCGQQKIPPWSSGSERSTERIIGGLEAVSGSWPWMIHMPDVQCGGVLLNKRWVLTAAHCVVGAKLDDGSWALKTGYRNYTVVAGRHHKTTISQTEQVLGIQNIIVHPKFDRVQLGNAGEDNPQGIPINDIALILLKQKASFVPKNVAPICLPTQDVAVGESCVIAGWGARELLAALSLDYKDTLHYAHVYVISNRVCNTYLDLRGSVTSEMICAGYEGGGADSCSGDSGGPLMCKGPDGGYQVRGIVSWGRGCGKRHRPGIYTRVYSFYPWISNTILK